MRTSKKTPKLSRHPVHLYPYFTYKSKKYRVPGKWPADHENPPLEVMSAFFALVKEVTGSETDSKIQPLTAPGSDPRCDNFTIASLVAGFLDDYEIHHGKTEARNIGYAFRELIETYGESQARYFGPKALKQIQELMVASGRTRQGCNRSVKVIRMAFAWGVGEELFPAQILYNIRPKIVKPLMKGLTTAPESVRKGAVPDSVVDSTLPFLPPPMRALVDLARYCAARPSELCNLTTGSIDQTDPDCWFYIPPEHKTKNRSTDKTHQRDRMIPFGPKCQEILRPWLKPDDPDRYLFSPADTVKILKFQARQARKTKVQPSQVDRSKVIPLKTAGSKYTTRAIFARIQAVCEKHGLPFWSPGQLRKTGAQKFLKAAGLESARAALGHGDNKVTTEHYVEQEKALAKAAALLVG